MGYRSDVVAIVYAIHEPFVGQNSVLTIDKEKRYPLLKTLMNTTFKEIADMWGSHFKWHDIDGVLVFKANDIKWYDSDQDIKAFGGFLQETENCGFEFECMRIGENYTDIEQHESSRALGFLQVERKIRIDI
jgi:hypothetical protein